MRKYRELPEKGEFVVIKILEVNPHSVFAKLLEYNKEGLIHISEVSRTWVRDIRKYVKINEVCVAQVLEVGKGSISLSLKRVNDNQKKVTLEEWNKEKKAIKFLEKLSEKLKIPMEEIYEKIAFPFQREFGNTFNGFEIALKEPERLKKVINDTYIKDVKEIAGKFIKPKEVKLERVLNISVPTPNGIDLIKKALHPEEKIKMTYISAPRYKLEVLAPDYKTGKERMRAKLEEIEKTIKTAGGNFSLEK